MASIAVEYVKPGMILDSDVKDINGRLLLTGGTEISEKHIHIFKTWGIFEVDIQGVTKESVEPDIAGQVDPVLLQKTMAELDAIFCHTDREHMVIKEIIRLCTLRKIKNLAGGLSDSKSS